MQHCGSRRWETVNRWRNDTLTVHIECYLDQFYCLDQRRLQIIRYIRGTFPSFMRMLTKALNTTSLKDNTDIHQTYHSLTCSRNALLSENWQSWSVSRTSRIHSTPHSFHIHFNIILPSMPRSSNTFSSLHVFRLNFWCIFHLCNAWHVPPPPQPI